MCVHIVNRVVKGTSKSLTDEMHTVMQTTDIPVAKDSKLTWREMPQEITLVAICRVILNNILTHIKILHGI